MSNRYLYYVMGFLLVLLVVLVGGVYAIRRVGDGASPIHNFVECVAAGNPTEESYPARCRTRDGRIFVEVIVPQGQASTSVASGTTSTVCTSSCSDILGYLEGQVTVGPICPVERVEVPCPTPPSAYTSQTITVYLPNGQSASTTHPNAQGVYRFALSPGRYVIDTHRSAIGQGRGTPTSIVIDSGKTVRVNVDIDTGIR